jgi:hypothetical protein
VIGAHTGVAPVKRSRPVSKATLHLCNPAVRDGQVSAEAVGFFANVKPRRPARPTTAPAFRSAMRMSDLIGDSTPKSVIDRSSSAAMHYEAQFSKRFGDGKHGRAVLRSESTEAAVQFQRNFLAHAESMAVMEQANTTTSSTGQISMRADGQTMEKMDFDSVYSDIHVHKDTESAIGHGFVPVVDPRLVARPKDFPYGRNVTVKSALGQRRLLPSRSFMAIGAGPGRSVDF